MLARIARLALLTLFVSLPLGSVLAHEFWIQPSSYFGEPGSVLRLSLMNGHRFEGSVVPRNSAYFERYEVVTKEDTQSTRGIDGEEVSYAKVPDTGSGVIVYEGKETPNFLPAERFHAYLREEGLGHIAQRREELGESDDEGREVYVRCAKALIGADAPSARDMQVELPLEIVLSDAEGASEGASEGKVTATVYFEGEPLRDAEVVFVRQDSPSQQERLTTDMEGQVTFEAGALGACMLTTIHMTRLDGRDDADWKSYWASLTFER